VKTLRMARCCLLWCLVSQLVPPPAFADAGLPTIIAIWPMSWLLLFMVIPLEAKIAQKIMKVHFGKALEISGRANFVSTLAGVPITWLILAAVELFLGGGSRVINHKASTSEWIYRSLIEGPILVPGHAPEWFIPATLFMMNFPFCLMSVYVERKATERFIDEVCTKELLRKWSWLANLASYLVINILVAIVAVACFVVKR